MDDPNPLRPIADSLWARLKRLDPWCSISMSRREPFLAPYRHCRRTWHVLVHDETAKAHEHVSTERPTLGEALEAAVAEAEKRGWPLPRPNAGGQSLRPHSPPPIHGP